MENTTTKQVIEISNIDGKMLINRLLSIENELKELKAKIHPTTNRKLTRKEVAEIFDISLTTVWTWQNAGILKPYKVGNRVYFLESEINKLVNKKETKAQN